MRIVSLEEAPHLNHPCALTIGSFDGVHLGHQALLKHLRSKLPPGGILVVFTFSNHPSHYFSPEKPVPLICPIQQKLRLLSDCGADLIITAPFDREFSQVTFDQFLLKLKEKLPFSHLALGQGAVFGKNREGTEERVKNISSTMKFHVDYLPKLLFNEAPLSSGRIRALIDKGEFPATEACLGRPYSLLGPLQQASNRFFLSFPDVCLPPEGSYETSVKIASQMLPTEATVDRQTKKIFLTLKPTLSPPYPDSELFFKAALRESR